MGGLNRLMVPDGLAALFGSKDRVRVLAVLANSERPLTAYRIAWIARTDPPNVYRELRSLSKEGEVRQAGGRGAGWTLVDPDVRRLMQRRLRISWSEEFTSRAPERAARADKLLREDPDFQLRPGKVPYAPEVVRRLIRRRLAKDAILRRGGGRPSIRVP